MSQSDWTQLIFRYFEEQAEKEHAHAEPGYMLVDQIWRGESWQEIVFALEHEHVGTDVKVLLDQEVSHLIDLRAKLKVGIFYPNLGDEKTLLNGISSRVSGRSNAGLRIPGERYMFIFGYDTRKERQRAIQFKAFFFDEYGKKTDQEERVILQGLS